MDVSKASCELSLRKCQIDTDRQVIEARATYIGQEHQQIIDDRNESESLQPWRLQSTLADHCSRAGADRGERSVQAAQGDGDVRFDRCGEHSARHKAEELGAIRERCQSSIYSRHGAALTLSSGFAPGAEGDPAGA